VVKIADSTVMAYRIVGGFTPSTCSFVRSGASVQRA